MHWAGSTIHAHLHQCPMLSLTAFLFSYLTAAPLANGRVRAVPFPHAGTICDWSLGGVIQKQHRPLHMVSKEFLPLSDRVCFQICFHCLCPPKEEIPFLGSGRFGKILF